MGRYYLSSLTGDGTESNPYKPPAQHFSSLNLRGDSTAKEGNVLVWVPDPIVATRLYDLGDDPDAPLSLAAKTRLEGDLRLTLDNTDSLGSVAAQLLIDHATPDGDKTRPNPLRFSSQKRSDPSDGQPAFYRGIYLGPPGTRIWEQYYKGGPGTTVSDNFNRSDETLAASANWTLTRNGTFEVATNEASYINDTGGSTWYRYESDLASDDMYGQAVVTQTISSTVAIMLLRHHASAVTAYYYRVQESSACNIDRVEAESFTTLASGTTTTAGSTAATLLYATADGSGLTMEWDGIEELTATDTNITGHTRAGLAGGANGNARVKMDNWEAGDLAATTVYPPFPPRSRRLVRM